MRTPRQLFLAALACLAGCEPPVPAGGVTQEKEGQVPVPPFSIEVSLDETAARKLAKAGETIKVAIHFDGDGDPLPGVKTAPFRDVFLGSHEFELDRPGTVRVQEAVISAAARARLKDPDYYLTANVVSGRRVFPENVLRDGHAQGKIARIAGGEPLKIHCTLP